MLRIIWHVKRDDLRIGDFALSPLLWCAIHDDREFPGRSAVEVLILFQMDRLRAVLKPRVFSIPGHFPIQFEARRDVAELV